MVTRRPIEITLVNTPNQSEEFVEFPRQGLYRITDFERVQKIITDLNLAVESECVSDDPIDLRIYSPDVPDLTMIDLPGYISITSRDQPPELKEKIVQLCRKYIQEPNIILAVCAADVDLANSEALNESRKVDPLGLRTLGVLTKMDLIDPQRGVDLIQNDKYPLQMGYVGVVCKSVDSRVMTTYKKQSIPADEVYFRDNYSTFAPLINRKLGIGCLRRKLMYVLETHMSNSLQTVVNNVRSELDDIRYQFKVQFNDQSITAESYTAEVLDRLKQKFRAATGGELRSTIRNEIKHLLDHQVMEICESLHWSDLNFDSLSHPEKWNEDDRRYWQVMLDKAHAQLAKSGVGRAATQSVVNYLTQSVEEILASEPFTNHPDTIKSIKELMGEILRARFYTTVDQVENTIKPFKYEVDFSQAEWKENLTRSLQVLKEEIKSVDAKLEEMREQVGRRKLRSAMQYVEELAKKKQTTLVSSTDNPEADDATKNLAVDSPFSAKLLAKAYEASRLQAKRKALEMRLYTISPGWIYSSICAASTAKLPGEKSCKAYCPEPYLLLIADKIASNAIMFIWVELINDFLYNFPRELDQRLYYGLNEKQILEFAEENPGVRSHLHVQNKKETLEKAMDKLMFIYKNREHFRVPPPDEA